MPLTDTTCRSAKCPEGPLNQRLSDAGGLHLEVTAAGAKYWRLKYRFAGKEKRLAIGVYPVVGLADARRARDEAKARLAAGIDPGEAKKEAKQALLLRAETAFEIVAREWFANWRTNKAARHAEYTIKRLEADAFPMIGDKPVGELTAPVFVRLAKKIETRAPPTLPGACCRAAARSCGMPWRTAWSTATRWPT